VYARTIVFLLLVLQCVTAQANHCFVNAQGVYFGAYDSFLPAPLDATGFIQVDCQSSEPFRVIIDGGLDGDSAFAYRRMQGDGASSLLYNLYLDPQRRQIWGDGSGDSLFYSGTPVGATTRLNVYGRIPPAQRVEPGSYRDAVVVTVEW